LEAPLTSCIRAEPVGSDKREADTGAGFRGVLVAALAVQGPIRGGIGRMRRDSFFDPLKHIWKKRVEGDA
jgi:hypothetical protein